MEKERIKQIILDNQETIKNRKVIKRDISIPFESIKKLNKIISIIGPRRAGKTYFLKQIIDELEISISQIVFLDFSEIALSNFNAFDFELILSSYYELFPDLIPFFFCDEIQEVKGFEKGLIYLLNKGFQIFITSSSSKMMIKEISSILRGKTLNFYIYPLSFKEYLRFKKISFEKGLSTRKKALLLKMLNDYILWGGFPEVVLSNDIETKRNLLSSYIDIMLFRDIIERQNIKNIHLVDKLFFKVIKSFTKEFSINKCFNEFKSEGLKVSKDTIYLYMKYFEETMFITFLTNISGGVTSFKKAYIVDNGLYNYSSRFENDFGKYLENQIFCDLQKKCKKIFFLKNNKFEIDFITEKTGIQVCYLLSEENKQREFKGLLASLNDKSIMKAELITYNEAEVKAPPNINISPYWKIAAY